MKTNTIAINGGNVVEEYKIISVNTNGIRAALNKGFVAFIVQQNPDIFCVEETKIGDKTIEKVIQELKEEKENDKLFKAYDYIFVSSKLKQGYAGTAVFTKKSIKCLGAEEGSQLVGKASLVNTEGRFIALELPQFYLITVYVPNSGRGDEKVGFLDNRLDWEDEIRYIISHMQKKKPVIYCGDMNVVREHMDIHDWQGNIGEPGMTDAERGACSKLLENCGLYDSFRVLHPSAVKYSWFSNFGDDRNKNRGWRLDYFFIDRRMQEYVVDSDVLDKVNHLSDHTPIILTLRFE